ncbi:MAG TPA: MarR family winged helix-turn-helix transcriptional regulator [Streptosporangiaceae bacterium]|jgi:hypothetical protein|nr:MarR family winged helix-turn-helix transcriptional regulator [Streptosporangiaceae bacterium]HEX2818816.1 MarR family winged helix-turn-helix transcriptional regulator [Streptosporangiaceae bacterium]
MAERRPDPVDRRAKLVAITDAGRTALDVANATWERLLTQSFGSLSEADRETLLRLLGSPGRGGPAADRGIGRPGRNGGLSMTGTFRPTIITRTHVFDPGV